VISTLASVLNSTSTLFTDLYRRFFRKGASQADRRSDAGHRSHPGARRRLATSPFLRRVFCSSREQAVAGDRGRVQNCGPGAPPLAGSRLVPALTALAGPARRRLLHRMVATLVRSCSDDRDRRSVRRSRGGCRFARVSTCPHVGPPGAWRHPRGLVFFWEFR
jgi:hypothetical protein